MGQTAARFGNSIIHHSILKTGAGGETCTLVGRFVRQFTKLLLSLLSHAGKKWWVATVLPRALRFKRPLHRCNACNPNRDTKAELNRRSQACEFLADTGISRRVKWSERWVPPPFDPAPEAGASLLGYALMNSPAH